VSLADDSVEAIRTSVSSVVRIPLETAARHENHRAVARERSELLGQARAVTVRCSLTVENVHFAGMFRTHIAPGIDARLDFSIDTGIR